MANRIRYILCGTTSDEDPISCYRLIAGRYLGSRDSAYRVRLPDDLVLTKYSCDSYSTTEDSRTLKSLGYDVIVRIDGKWVVRNDLKGVRMCDIYLHLLKEGFHFSPDGGYYRSRLGRQ